MRKWLQNFFNTIAFPFRKSLRLKVTAASVVTVILTAAFITSYSYQSVYYILKVNMSSFIEDNINKANDSMDMIIRDADRINSIVTMNESIGLKLRSSSDSPNYEWFMNVKSLNSFLTSLVKTKEKVFTGVSVIKTNGEILKGGTPQIREDFYNEEWYGKIVEAKGNSVILKRTIGEYGVSGLDYSILSVGRAIMRYGNIDGAVITDIDFLVLNNIYNIKGISKGGIFVFDDRQEVFEYVNDDNLSIMNSSSLKELLIQQVHNDKPQEIKIKGHDYIVVKSKSAYSNWTTVVLISKASMLKDFYKFSNSMLFLVAAIVIILLLLITVVIARITGNIKKLMNTMEDVSGGNINAKPDIHSIDEIGKLSRMFIIMMDKIQKLMDDIKNKEQEKRQAELKVLQAQINPHFLCNTLNTINYLSQIQNIKNISELTTSLVRLLRISIDNTERYITIKEELDYVKSYIDIQKYKYADSLKVAIFVQDEILELKTIKMILQPLVENAIIHGIEPSEQEGLITIKVYTENNHVKFKVTDNGIGMSEEVIESLLKNENKRERSRFSGIGIYNVQERIKMNFGEEYGIKIFSQIGLCTTVEVEIPVVE